MGLMDKIWDEVFAGPQPSAPNDAQNAARSTPGSKMQLEITVPESSLARTESLSTPPQSPSDEGRQGHIGRNDLDEGGSVRLRGAASKSIHITNEPPSFDATRRVSLDSARSLPSGFNSYIPEILSPGSARRENVWRSVFHPGSNKATQGLGSSKFDKADPKGPSVYDWFYRPTSRSQFR